MYHADIALETTARVIVFDTKGRGFGLKAVGADSRGAGYGVGVGCCAEEGHFGEGFHSSAFEAS